MLLYVSKVPIVVCSTSALPKILTEVETFEERCYGNLSQKKPWLPQITPKFGQKRALGGPKIGQFFCDSFVKTPIKHVGKI